MFLQELKGFDIPHDTRLANLLNAAELKEAEDLVQMGADRVSNGDQLLSRSASGAYQSFLGYYLGQMKRIKMRNKEDLVDVANTLSSGMGFKRAPGLTKRMVGKMGLKGVRGIEITEDEAGHGQVGGRRGHFDGRRSPNAGRSKRKGR
jgi:ATP-dependent RNA helicase MSS116